MLKTDRWYNVLNSVIFYIFIISPFLLFLILPTKNISEAEKRKLAVLPKIKKEYNEIFLFPKRLNEFYNDHFGLRDNLIRLNNITSLNIFNETSTPFVLKGRDGWFFYTGEGVIEDYFGQQQTDKILRQ